MSLTEEESNFLRFYFLNMKVATKAVRVYFDSIYPPVGLAQELINNKSHLQSLNMYKIITTTQMKIVYPGSVGIGKSDQFDTTLLICLLRNMKPCKVGPVPATGWDHLPNATETYCGADLARVKWYRNYVSHHGKGELLRTDFSKYWGDLEQAITRLGGLSMQTEAQSAQHVVLDRSLKDMLLELRNCEKSLEKQTDKIKIHEAVIDSLNTSKEEFQKEADQLIVSHQELEDTTQTLTNTISDYKETIDACSKKIETCKNDIKKNEEIIKELQDQSELKKNRIDDLFTQIDTLEIKYEQQQKMLKEHSEHLTMHDGQIETFVKSIDDMKQKLHDTDDTSEKIKQKRLGEDTRALIEEDIREGTFVTTKAVTDGLLLLKQNGVLLITGYAGTGKSRIGRHVLHRFCTDDTSYTCIKLNTLEEWEDMVNREENIAVLIDDIFGETNCIYNREKDASILDKIHAYVCKGNIKVIITIRDTVKHQCQEVFDSHRLFKFDFIDLYMYVLNKEEKYLILKNYMKAVRDSNYDDTKGFLDCKGDTILNKNQVSRITEENSLKEFPLVVYQFVYNDKYLNLGSKFFDRPTEAMLKDINTIRQKGEDDRKVMIQYAVMVYTAINENCINPDDNRCISEIPKIIDAIYDETIKLKKCQISDVIKQLEGSYLVHIPNRRSYRFHHQTLQEGVILSFAQIDEETMNKIIPLLSWSFFLKMIKSEAYIKKEGEVVLRIPTNSYNLLGSRLASISKHNFRRQVNSLNDFVRGLSLSEIFKHENCLLLNSILKALEKEDDADNHSELLKDMIRTNESNSYNNYCSYLHLKDNVFFLAFLIVNVAKKKEQTDMYKRILQMVKQLITTSNNEYFLINYVRVALIRSFYEICATKDVRSVQDTLNIVKEIEITVLLDQGINFNKISLPDIRFWRNAQESDNTCIFLTFCIAKAYAAFNVDVIEYLISKYNDTFDVNLFLKMFYSTGSLLSHKPLKWMIEKFIKDYNVVDIEFVLGAACKYQLLDTVEYLTSIREKFSAISCLKIFLGVDEDKQYIDLEGSDKELFHFLFSKTESSSTELTRIIISLLKKSRVPDYIIDAFLPICLNNDRILTLACTNAHFNVAKLLLENSQKVDIQSALVAACLKSEMYSSTNSKVEKLEVVKYIIEKFEYTKLDLKAACEQAYHSKLLYIIEWFIKNIDLTLLDVNYVIKSVCVMIENDNTTKYSTRISQIVGILWNGLKNKEEQKMVEIVNTAYENKCFELLVWIHENCKPKIAIDVNKLLAIAFENDRVDVVKWILLNFELTSEDIAGKVEELLDTAYENKCLELLIWTHINGNSSISLDAGKLFMIACDEMSGYEMTIEKSIDMVNWVIENFQLSPLDLKLGVLKLFSCSMRKINKVNKNLFSFSVSILEKCFNCLCPDDMDEIINELLGINWYFLLDWFLENRRYYPMNKQKILNKACKDCQIETIKLLKDYFHSLDMNEAFLCACIHINSPLYYTLYDLYGEVIFNDDVQCVACLDMLWKYNQGSIDIYRIVHKVCEANNVKNRVMTWILQNLPYEQIPIHEVLVSCCQQNKIHHVKYIFFKVDIKHIDIKSALEKTCLVPTQDRTFNRHHNLVDYLLTKVNIESAFLRQNFFTLLYNGKSNLILYLLHRGQNRDIFMDQLMGLACLLGETKLVQWLLKNVEYEKLNIKTSFLILCENGKIEYDRKLRCVALMWHFIPDMSKFEIDTITKATLCTPNMSDDHEKDWTRYINYINETSIRVSAFKREVSFDLDRNQQTYNDMVLFIILMVVFVVVFTSLLYSFFNTYCLLNGIL